MTDLAKHPILKLCNDVQQSLERLPADQRTETSAKMSLLSHSLSARFSDNAMAADINVMVAVCHNASKRAGWWNDLRTGQPVIERPHVVGEKLMLIVSEVAEAMEGHRKNLNDDKLPHRKMVEVELADAVIRIADLAGAMGLNLGCAIVEKLAYNANRPDHKPENRKAEGGKAY